jgi:hypothetical protein
MTGVNQSMDVQVNPSTFPTISIAKADPRKMIQEGKLPVLSPKAETRPWRNQVMSSAEQKSPTTKE